ncbi:hypothetical protein [Microbacterium sp. NPDC076911]|uniref:hypothetical protein n=1 Tax=Microbacterium sp. NPDC076911 TaxID=3154958 RepID=UPI00341204EB
MRRPSGDHLDELDSRISLGLSLAQREHKQQFVNERAVSLERKDSCFDLLCELVTPVLGVSYPRAVLPHMKKHASVDF